MTRTWLFVPGDRPERFGKALGAGADQIIIDLEDAVAPNRKHVARDALAAFLATSPTPVAIRINAVDSTAFGDDLALLASPAVAVVVVPKADDPRLLARLASSRPGLAVIPLVETARGLAAARELAAAPGVERLAFGHIDLQADLGLRGAEEAALLPFRLEVVLASRLARIAPPLDGVTVSVDDEVAVAEDARRARRLGFGGKLCIHPRQVAAVRAAFAPDAAEVAWARHVLGAAAAVGGAAVAVDGAMIDRPVILRAQAILDDLARN